ncbi:hypothetical protein IMX26_00265 [Clostridium sp. 'deep sea']|uniref:hypothetical protein n=1 Tax=Clostridium sp. 'deep sea' TaxID=2779445 RepID=UPI0018967C2D|nr:hypothetical protein [Clostridium sp. 'deep sea']QOR35311.1 hypothetical protein IMX26_00265 [Clostridium sp. 'deep sea']
MVKYNKIKPLFVVVLIVLMVFIINLTFKPKPLKLKNIELPEYSRYEKLNQVFTVITG